MHGWEPMLPVGAARERQASQYRSGDAKQTTGTHNKILYTDDDEVHSGNLASLNATRTPGSVERTVGDSTVGEGGASSSMPALECARFRARPA